jgi:hypothetical protein
MRVKIVVSLVTILIWAAQAQADLLQQYMDNNNSPTRGQISYGFGANIPVGPSGNGNIIDLSAGIQKQGSCGNFDLAGEIKSIFNKEALDQYVSGLTGAIVSSAPLLLLCYASQTLCDLYKHYRNMANAALSMRHAQCSQIEALAEKAGSSLRNNSIMQCISDKIASEGYDAAVAECGQGDPTLQIPNSTTTATQFSLSDAMAKAGTSDPALQDFIKGVIGDVRFSAGYGIYNAGKTENGMETQVGNYTTAFYNASRDVGEQFKATRRCPDDSTLNNISIPGVPISCFTLTRLSALDPATRDNFYRQYSTVAAMNTMLYKMEAAIDLLQQTKAATQDKDTIATIEDGIKEMQRDYDLMEKRLALQQNYLIPMMNSLFNYSPPSHDALPSDQERQFELPKSILP